MKREEEKKRAFSLYQEGAFQASLDLCTVLARDEKDQSLDVLAATNLFSLGALEEAEARFRDLALLTPDSSYVHSYLGKVLAAAGNEEATAEYIEAVRLDPENQEGLRAYGAYLAGKNDTAGAVPVLSQLVRLSGREEDVKTLASMLLEQGNGAVALDLYARYPPAGDWYMYIEALMATDDQVEALRVAEQAYRKTGEQRYLHQYLSALAVVDQSRALTEYAVYADEEADPAIRFDYLLLLRSKGDLEGALSVATALVASAGAPVYHLVRAELLAALDRKDEAEAAFVAVIKQELSSMEDPETLDLLIRRYREFLMVRYDQQTVLVRFRAVIGDGADVVSLLAMAALYTSLDDPVEARSWYYRAYRADFLNGGLLYAEFLIGTGDQRECEKVVLYLLGTLTRVADLERVAAVVLDQRYGMYRLPRLLEKLIACCEASLHLLSSAGRELCAVAFLVSATDAFEAGQYPRCKECCLRGLDLMPGHPRSLQPGDFFALLVRCKEESLADTPVLGEQRAPEVQVVDQAGPEESGPDLDLDPVEEQVVAFLRTHTRAEEQDLRTLLGTRRVSGIVNRLIRKAAAAGVEIIAKQGVGENGEIYEYVGR
ncbi:tetratricopeptide repeat protein [Methanosphaerula palustris]|uniref:Tetratricopeptide TPR_4 n=1 Tax=Methanosphaerula palustris (strain ATCC BAA-1556 / DSM 19958 / E1-9c) TaxID=521011 RepID=B8GIB7_METPE|nr:hypothetical protein [Methanosphaerula palustris]ACL15468.1 Tetratricopeptide TPR_4 [Methanosphaerula palustris E1-9c]